MSMMLLFNHDLLRAESIRRCRADHWESHDCVSRVLGECKYIPSASLFPLTYIHHRTGRANSASGQSYTTQLSSADGSHRLGRDRIGVFDGTKDKKLVKQFVNSYACSCFNRSLTH